MPKNEENRIVPTGHRMKQSDWYIFLELAKSYGITGNQAINRLVYDAMERWQVPGFHPVKRKR